MARKLTSLNPHHPRTRLIRFEESVYKTFQALSRAHLSAAVANAVQNQEIDASTLHLPRHKQIAALLTCAVKLWKAKWEENYGWPFDDCLDDLKLRSRIQEMRDEEKRKEFPLREEVQPRPEAIPAKVFTHFEGDREWRKKPWRINLYVCQAHKNHITTTVDVDEGVTPFMITCPHCGGTSYSKMYPSHRPIPDWIPEPSFEWYAPSREQVDAGVFAEAEIEHINRGGLMMRERTEAPAFCHPSAAQS